MEMAPAVPSATEFQALKTTKGSDSQRKRLSQIFILVFGPLVSPAVFSHIPGVQGGREANPSRSKDSWLRGQGWGGTRDIPRSQENREILRLPELVPSPDSVGNRDLGGGSGIEGGHGPGSAPSAALGDGFFWEFQHLGRATSSAIPSGSALSLKVTRWRPKASFAFGKVVEVGNAAVASPPLPAFPGFFEIPNFWQTDGSGWRAPLDLLHPRICARE